MPMIHTPPMDSAPEHPSASSGRSVNCPRNGQPGRPVLLKTVKALLRDHALGRLGLASHYFCPDEGCDVVYFDQAGAVYDRLELREPVWQKEPSSHRKICYCFGENEEGIRAELHSTGDCLAVARIRAHIAAGRCACDVRNPRGVCCLGDVMHAVERLRRMR